MNTTSVIDRYIPTLIKLDNDKKISIIEALLLSMRNNTNSTTSHPNVENLFSGDWENDIPAGQLADDYRANRYYDTDKKIEW